MSSIGSHNIRTKNGCVANLCLVTIYSYIREREGEVRGCLPHSQRIYN